MVKYAELFKGVITALAADGTFNGLIAGRVYTRVPRSPTFPFVRIVSLPASPAFGTLNASHPNWRWQGTLDFTAFSLSTSPVQASNVIDALGDVIEDKTNMSVTGATLVSVIPRTSGIVQDETTQTWTGLASYDFILDES